MQIPPRKERSRNFFSVIGRAFEAHREFERLSAMSDKGLAERNLTRGDIAHYILGRL